MVLDWLSIVIKALAVMIMHLSIYSNLHGMKKINYPFNEYISP